jgi:pyroglutamyl-peptidase
MIATENDPTKKQDDNIHEVSSSSISFIVTGFGPFGTVKENPTTVIVKHLPSYLAKKSTSMDATVQRTNQELSKLIEDFIILETSAEDVCRVMEHLQLRFAKQQFQTCRVLLHLGVDEKSRCFKLESCAYNEATFRIPDQRGYAPKRKAIFPEETFAACFQTTLDLTILVQTMTQRFPNIKTVISKDPGRYVCNYVYCNSLQRFGKKQQDRNENNVGIFRSLFLHVPPFSAVPENDQLAYVASLMDVLASTTMMDNTIPI